ncbi:hypothetical protein [Tepidibacter formicigenes]|jgi:hypothetical protein|uniref:Uncharacterized protein n=1 Tax=Tepidibacter formicigenes DSM 15518 TaxID=1123349 RepID=A0A1M6MXH8_9FIRM|nr:hypothetical protein [Tepidibacter formicigenes]SHJ88100.1 hypothetical protein SAMN02744037_01092 [Tepidibacter formicigenes DSM 15518]
MDIYIYSKLWAKFTELNNNLGKCIIKLIDSKWESEVVEKLLEYVLEYFEVKKQIDNIIPTEPKDNVEKMFRSYVDVNLGILAIEFNKMKENNNELYKHIIRGVENEGYFRIEELLEKYHEKLLENYTPRDIYIMSGGKEEDYDGWY